jgi:hypothetical protein
LLYFSLLHKPQDNIAHNGTIKTEGVENDNGYSKEQWLSIQRNPGPESKNRKETKTTAAATTTTKRNNKTETEMGSLHIPQPINQKGNQPV